MPTPRSNPSISASPKSPTSTERRGPRPVFFWKQRDYDGYLCQWYYSPFTVGGETYATAETWMMVQKARCFNDEATAIKIFKLGDEPRKQKALGRKVQGFDEKVWDERKLEIVTQGTYYKFTKSRDADSLRRMLLATGDRELAEASPFDRVWGIGFTADCAEMNRESWGQNLLGRALMDVRARLREEEEEKEKKKREREGEASQ